MKDQLRIENFLKELSDKLAKKYGRDLDFILLFGSAARGDWQRGLSDVDLIIQTKKQSAVVKVKKYLDKIFWQLDEKHRTKLKEVCSTATGQDEMIKNVLKKTELYVPYEVFGPKDIDWQNGQIRKKEFLLGAKLVASQAMIFKKMKIEGKILYGRDIRKVIEPKNNWWEKTKALLVPYHVALAAAFLSLIFPKIALKMAHKSAIYSVSSTLFFLDRPIGKGFKKEAEKLEKEIKTEYPYQQGVLGVMEIDFILNFDYRKLINFDFAKEILKLKYNWREKSKKFDQWQTLKFSLRALSFVNSMNWYAILKADKNHFILTSLFILRTILVFLILLLIIYYL